MRQRISHLTSYSTTVITWSKRGRVLTSLRSLVGKTWLEAWQSSESTKWGFLQDVERVRRVASRSNEQEVARSGRAPHLHYEVKCALIRASLISLSRGHTTRVAASSARQEPFGHNQALVDARQGPVPLNRALALALIAPRLNAPEAHDLLDEAATIARGLESAERSEAFKAVCLAWVAVGDFHRAEQAQRVIEDERWRKELLVANAERFANALDPELLFGAIEGMDDEHSLDVLLAVACKVDGEVRKNFIERAKSAADSLPEQEKPLPFSVWLASIPNTKRA